MSFLRSNLFARSLNVHSRTNKFDSRIFTLSYNNAPHGYVLTLLHSHFLHSHFLHSHNCNFCAPVYLRSHILFSLILKSRTFPLSSLFSDSFALSHFCPPDFYCNFAFLRSRYILSHFSSFNDPAFCNTVRLRFFFNSTLLFFFQYTAIIQSRIPHPTL